MKNERFLPEGYAPLSTLPLPLSNLEELMEQGAVVEGMVLRCDARHDLHVKFCGYDGLIPREEAVLPEISGADREIAVLSRVGHSAAFVITGIDIDGGGRPRLRLSRRRAQAMALEHLLACCPVGTVVRGRITHLARFGAFVDIGCGVVALLPLEHISVARISHPNLRFTVGQNILAAVKGVDAAARRFTLTHRELLGTWLENAAQFAPGETVTGFVRGIKDYGVFVELTPNLSGLAEGREDLRENDAVSVFIKSSRPEQQKIKLQILQKTEQPPQPLRYFITGGTVEFPWQYAPEEEREGARLSQSAE